MSDIRPPAGSLWLVVESVDSPGNLGTIVRTAEATGVAGIFVIGSTADPHDPAAIRATTGSLFSLPLVRCSVREFVDWARRFDVAVVGTSPTGLLDYKWPAALLVGNEKHGLSGPLKEACDFMVRIPMLGRGDSINAAVAAGVLLYELFSQRGY